MRRRILAVVFLSLVIATGAEARGLWIGPHLAFPVPARDVGDHELGIGAGVTCDIMIRPYVGFGVDFVYHYWPASSAYKAAFDRHLRSTRFQVIDSPTWAFSAIQATYHVKLVAPLSACCSPWVRAGVGYYRLDRHLAEPSLDGVYAYIIGADPINTETSPGWYGGAGFDLRIASNVALGLNASYHHVWSEDDSNTWLGDADMPDFSAFSVGAHILFGW